MKMALRISDLAREGGVGVETVRFYQRKGLLDAPEGEATGGRHYGSEDVRRLRYIRQAQTAGFTLAEIAELIDLDRKDDRPRARWPAWRRIARGAGRGRAPSSPRSTLTDQCRLGLRSRASMSGMIR